MDLLKEVKDKKVYHVSHSDLDGNVSHLVGEYYLSPICLYTPLKTNRDWDEFDWERAKSSDFVIFTDITPSKEMYEKILLSDKPKILIYDHHVSGKEELGDIDNYFYDLSRCGAKIFYDEVLKNVKRHNRVFDRIIELTNIYDLFNTKHPDWSIAKSLNNSLYGYVDWGLVFSDFPPTETEKYYQFIKSNLYKIDNYKRFHFSKFELEKIEKANQKEDDQYKKCRRNIKFRVDGQGNTYGYIEAQHKASFVAYRLLNEFNHKIKYLLIYNTFEEDSNYFSLRSHAESDMDVSKIAEKWEGGGHKNASAFKCVDRENIQLLKSGKIHLI